MRLDYRTFLDSAEIMCSNQEKDGSRCAKKKVKPAQNSKDGAKTQSKKEKNI